MKNKYVIGESVEDTNTLKTYKIKDYESFGEMVLYYFEDGTALPEKDIKVKGFTMIKEIISIPNEEKNRQYRECIKLMNKRIDDIFK